jgi:hypothetical protein
MRVEFSLYRGDGVAIPPSASERSPEEDAASLAEGSLTLVCELAADEAVEVTAELCDAGFLVGRGRLVVPSEAALVESVEGPVVEAAGPAVGVMSEFDEVPLDGRTFSLVEGEVEDEADGIASCAVLVDPSLVLSGVVVDDAEGVEDAEAAGGGGGSVDDELLLTDFDGSGLFSAELDEATGSVLVSDEEGGGGDVDDVDDVDEDVGIGSGLSFVVVLLLGAGPVVEEFVDGLAVVVEDEVCVAGGGAAAEDGFTSGLLEGDDVDEGVVAEGEEDEVDTEVLTPPLPSLRAFTLKGPLTDPLPAHAGTTSPAGVFPVNCTLSCDVQCVAHVLNSSTGPVLP